MYRRWIVVVSLGEMLGFAVPTAAWALGTTLSLADLPQAALLVLAGAGEGAVLGYAQSRVLRTEIPGFESRDWIGVTSAAAAFAWAVGMLPSTLGERAMAAVPMPLLIALGAVLGTLLLLSIGGAQFLVLRRYVPHAHRWIWANAAAWLLGLAVVFLCMGVAPPIPFALTLFSLAGGLGMGITVAAVTGCALVSLLRARQGMAEEAATLANQPVAVTSVPDAP